MKQPKDKRLVAVYTDIGRGHPNYLDSTLRAVEHRLDKLPKYIKITSVFEISRGMSLFGWKTIRRIYRSGAQGGLVSSLYNKARGPRSNGSRKNKAIRVLGKSLHKYFEGYEGVVLVAHPILAHILGQACRVYYIHGEIASPLEFDFSRSEKIFVPLQETADAFISGGIPGDNIVVTGLMLEPELASKTDLIKAERLDRLEAGETATIGFYNSGAYPKSHVWQIIEGAEHILKKNLGNIVISCGSEKRQFERFKSALSQYGPTTNAESFEKGESRVLLQHHKDRQELTLQEIDLLPDIDLAVMAAHERTNWTLALQLPTIFLKPNIGNFAPMNYEYACQHATVFPYQEGHITEALDKFIVAWREKDDILKKTDAEYDPGGCYQAADIIIRAID
ncbi:MAG TPA: hypothetical protein ENO22_08475 [candidate division Zixibacteria bacterium]|nr:hypothetical protein [candidate division Zixibacteria bacterium]HEQ99357.1 hypothetical protein [candidate division Zixibacteria bacterium]